MSLLWKFLGDIPSDAFELAYLSGLTESLEKNKVPTGFYTRKNPGMVPGDCYNALTALKPLRHRMVGVKNRIVWLFQCECGNLTESIAFDVKRGGKKSCGCWIKKHNYKRLPIEEKKLRAYIRNNRSGAEYRGLEWTLSREDVEVLVREACNYCGTRVLSRYMGIDRVDNSKGYHKENCVASCWDCNRMKYNMTRESFLAHVLKIGAHCEQDIPK